MLTVLNTITPRTGNSKERNNFENRHYDLDLFPCIALSNEIHRLEHQRGTLESISHLSCLWKDLVLWWKVRPPAPVPNNGLLLFTVCVPALCQEFGVKVHDPVDVVLVRGLYLYTKLAVSSSRRDNENELDFHFLEWFILPSSPQLMDRIFQRSRRSPAVWLTW